MLGLPSDLRPHVDAAYVAMRHTQDGIWMVRTAEAALRTAESLVSRLRDLESRRARTRAGSGTVADLDAEARSLREDLRLLLATTAWNGRPLLDGSAHTLQVGTMSSDRITIATPGLAIVRDFAAAAPSVTSGALDVVGTVDTVLHALARGRDYLSTTATWLGFALQNLLAAQDSMVGTAHPSRPHGFSATQVSPARASLVSSAYASSVGAPRPTLALSA